MKRKIFILVALVILSLVWAVSVSAQSNVPDSYSALYQNLESQLVKFDQKLNAMKPASAKPISFSGELMTANSHMQDRLLTPDNWNTTLFMLDRLQDLGMETVRISVEYPVFWPANPRYAEHLKFYRDLVSEIRRRGMKVAIHSNVLFNNPEWNASCGAEPCPPIDYSQLTYNNFKSIKRQMAQIIIRELGPDYLTIANEPTTLYGITGRPEFLDPVKYRELVNYVLFGLDRKNTSVGAGAGNWENLRYIYEIASRTSVDFIDLHVYPVNLDLLNRLVNAVDIARLYHKRIILGEVGLQKIGDDELGEGGVATSPVIFSRDAFSFWAPLDSLFLAEMAKLSRIKGIELIAPFFTRHFFGYVEYSESTGKLSAADLMCLDGITSGAAMMNGLTSSYGEAYSALKSIYP